MRRELLRWIIVTLVLAGIAFVGGYWYAARRPQLTPQPTGVVTKPSVVVYVPLPEGADVRWEAKPVPVAEGEDPLQVALRHLLITRDTPFPQGTRLLGAEVRDDLVEVNFSRELIDNFPGGSTSEVWIVQSLCKTLAQFPDVNRVRLLVEGKPIETIGEHLDLSEPIPVRPGRQ